MAAIDDLRLLCMERYNITAPDLSSSLFAAIEAGDAAAIRRELDAREMYRWREPIEDALAALESPSGAPEGFAVMTIKELRGYAAEHEIDLGDATRKADLIAAIELAGESQVLTGDGSGEALPPLPDSAYPPGAVSLPE